MTRGQGRSDSLTSPKHIRTLAVNTQPAWHEMSHRMVQTNTDAAINKLEP